MSDFLKRGLIISGIVGTLAGGFYYLMSVLKDFAFEWDVCVLIAFLIFCTSSLFFYIASFFVSLEEYAIKDVVNEIPEESREYVYGAYINEMCRVERITRLGKQQVITQTNYIDIEGNYIADTWYDAGADFMKDTCAVFKDGRFALINKQGKVVSDWFATMLEFKEGYAKVYDETNNINYIKEDGTLLWKEWKAEAI